MRRLFVFLGLGLVSACGGVTSFVGTYSGQVTSTVVCDSQHHSDTSVYTWAIGQNGDLVALNDRCGSTGKIDGNEVHLDKTVCPVVTSSDGSSILTLNSGTLILSGSTLQVSLSGDLTLIGADGSSQKCRDNIAGTMIRQ